MIRLIKEWLDIASIWAQFIFSVVIMGAFEYMFHWIGVYVADHKKALKLIGRDEEGQYITEETTLPPEEPSPIQEPEQPAAPIELKPKKDPRTETFELIYNDIKANLPTLQPISIENIAQHIRANADRYNIKPQAADTLAQSIYDNLKAQGEIQPEPAPSQTHTTSPAPRKSQTSNNWAGATNAYTNVTAPTPMQPMTINPTMAMSGNTALKLQPELTQAIQHEPEKPSLTIVETEASHSEALPQENPSQTFTGNPKDLPVNPLGTGKGETEEAQKYQEVAIELLRAYHLGKLKNPTFPQCKKILIAAGLGANTNERETLITDAMENVLKPEGQVIDHPERGEKGKPNWTWASDFKRKPENWNEPDYQYKD